MASRSLGTLTLDLVTKIAGFTGPLDKAERELDKRTKKMQRMANGFGKALGVAIGSGFALAAAGLTIYVKNAIEAERVQTQLSSRIKDTGGAAGKSIDDLNRMATALQNLTTFDDESIGRVQAMLLTFRNIKGDNFDGATKAVLNLSVAMGTDLNSAALQVGKALNDPVQGISALSRAGVQFSEDQKKAIKAMVETGNAAGAQKIILKELEGEMGTAAEAARNTLGGAFEGLKNTIDNLLEGDASSGGLKGTKVAIDDLNNALNDPAIKSGIDTVATGLLKIAGSAVTAIGKLGELIAAVREYGAGNADKGMASLVNNRADLETKLFRAQRSSPLAPSNASLPFMDKLFGTHSDRAGYIADLQKQIAGIDAEITRRNKAAGDQFAKYRGLDPKNGLFVPQHPQAAVAAAVVSAGGARSGGGTRKDADDAAEALKRLTEAQDEWHSHVLDMVADLSGPAAQAEREYQKALADLNDAYKEGKVRQEDYAKAQELLAQQRDAEIAKIKEQLSPAQELIQSMQDELALIGLTNAEREKAIALRQAGANATDAERAKIAELVGQMQMASREADFWNETQRDLSDALFNTVTGAESAADAIKGFFDDLARYITRMISEQWAQKITDLFKRSADSSGGSGWGGFLGALFGGGKASGGWAMPNTMYEVNERGFEMASVGGRDYLLTGDAPVNITPNHMLGSGVTNNNYFTFAAPTEQRTQAQMAQRVAFETRRASSRNN